MLTDSKLLIRCYREDQPELAVRHLLYGVNAFILCLGVLQQYLQGGDWLLDVNLPGLKLISQGAPSSGDYTHLGPAPTTSTRASDTATCEMTISRTVDFVYLQNCPDDDCSIAVETVGIKCLLLKNNVWLVYQESLIANYVRLLTESSITKHKPKLLSGILYRLATPTTSTH